MSMTFNDGEEEAHIKYAIHFDENNKSLYYFLYISNNHQMDQEQKKF